MAQVSDVGANTLHSYTGHRCGFKASFASRALKSLTVDDSVARTTHCINATSNVSISVRRVGIASNTIDCLVVRRLQTKKIDRSLI